MFTANDFLDYIGTAAPATRPIRPRPAPRPNPRPTPAAEPIPAQKPPALAPKPGLELVMYSEKSFAIFGETKPVKDQLMALGGSFNRSLKRDDKPTPGYIFSLKRIDTVRKAFNL